MKICLIYGMFLTFVHDSVKWIEADIGNEYYILCFGKNVYKNILDTSLEHIHIITDISHSKIESWSEYYQQLDDVQEKYQFDRIALIALYQEFCNKKDSQILEYYEETFKDDRAFFGFNFMQKKALNFMSVLYMNLKHKIPVDHFMIDPPELDLSLIGLSNVRRYFFYDYEKINAKHSSYAEYMLRERSKNRENFEKNIDFVFGFSIELPPRYWFHMYYLRMRRLLEEAGLKSEFYYSSQVDENKCMISKPRYLQRLEESRYSLVIPSYVETEFSMIRFLEIISKDCIPLIFYKTNLDSLKKLHPTFCDVIEKHSLIVNPYEMVDLMKKADYETILHDFKSCQDFKKLNKLSYLKKNFRTWD